LPTELEGTYRMATTVLDHSNHTILPLEAELIARATAVEQSLRDGELVTYDEMDELDDMRRDEMERRLSRDGLTLTEKPGDGYHL
jgi:hypothetical protein